MQLEYDSDPAVLIKAVRLAMNRTQAEFAYLFHVHQTQVSQWEHGRWAPDEVVEQVRNLALAWNRGYERGRHDAAKELRTRVESDVLAGW